MSKPIPRSKLLHVPDRRRWRAWLRKNYRTSSEIWLVFYKKHTGKARVTYNDAVEEALCFGWIDSIVRTIDGDRFAQRFSPRRPGSNWSATNLERLRLLVRQGKVARDVLPTLPELDETALEISPDILKAIRSNPEAWRNFQAFSSSYKRIRIAYIESARRRPEEFRKRLANFIRKTEAGRMIGFGGVEKHY